MTQNTQVKAHENIKYTNRHGGRMPKIGEQINLLLASKKIKRAMLIDQAGISASALAQYISGKITPKLETICKLADLFEVSLDELICGNIYTPESNLNPIEEAFEQRLDALLARSSERRDLSVRVGMLLADQIEAAIHSLALSDNSPGGFLTDDETMLLEALAEETWIGSMNFIYDIQAHNGSTQTGRFTKVVASNLKNGRKYKFLIPAHISQEQARELSDKYRVILRDTYQCTPADIKRCEFKYSQQHQYAGVGFYRLNTAQPMPGKTRILLEKIQAFTDTDGHWLGYVIPPSNQVHGDVLMDGTHLALGLKLFETQWRAAVRI